MGLESLPDLAMDVITSKLGPKHVSILACVSSRCRSAASHDNVWRHFCTDDIGLSAPEDPDGNACPSYKVAYQSWRESFGMYPWMLVRRVKKCWSEINDWIKTNYCEAHATLQKGAAELEIKEVEEKLGVKLPLPTRVLYRFCNGQNTLLDDIFKNGHLGPLGLIGGYSFYDHVVNVHFLPLNLVFEETRKVSSLLGLPAESNYIVVAISCYVEKFFLLNCSNGQLYVGTRNLMDGEEMLPCVPYKSIKLDQSDNPQQDALLLWLEEHGRRLRERQIQIRKFYTSHSINLFPELPPISSTAVTNGVQIRASAVLIPELCNPKDERDAYWFSYSIRMRLLPEGGILDGIYFNSCQLLSRHWIIRANGNVVSDVSGDGVIGKYPLLSTDRGEFVYESCTPLPSTPGSVEGSFTFIPGRVTSPEGRPFEVKVACFNLEVPSYIF